MIFCIDSKQHVSSSRLSPPKFPHMLDAMNNFMRENLHSRYFCLISAAFPISRILLKQIVLTRKSLDAARSLIAYTQISHTQYAHINSPANLKIYTAIQSVLLKLDDDVDGKKKWITNRNCELNGVDQKNTTDSDRLCSAWVCCAAHTLAIFRIYILYRSKSKSSWNIQVSFQYCNKVYQQNIKIK